MIKEFEYTGQIESITLEPALYKVECYGAKGGTNNAKNERSRSNGGYVAGFLTLQHTTTLFICVGKHGGNSSDPTNGFNGGGSSDYENGGGGATHVALSNYGTLNNYDNHRDDILLVAGGGGGAAKTSTNNQGHGGGLESGPELRGYNKATQDKGYSFGKGQDGVNNNPGGGGGWFGGRSSDSMSFNASGGSGYVSKTLNEPIYETGANTELDGYVIITKIDDLFDIFVNKDNVITNYKASTRYDIIIQDIVPNNTLLFDKWICEDFNLGYKELNQTLKIKSPGYPITLIPTYKSNRLNADVYKYYLHEKVMNFSYLNTLGEHSYSTPYDVEQMNHGFKVGDVLYKDGEMYYKAIAEDSYKAFPVGIVSAIKDAHDFTILKNGSMDYSMAPYEDTTILYLSDTTPGKMVHYSEIQNTIYVPVAICANNKLIVNIQNGSIGYYLAPYDVFNTNFETYDKQDLDEIVNIVYQGVKDV